jgi:Lamin Tail Domain
VNEVSDAGTFNTCGGNATVAGADWVELQNRGSSSVNITGYRMYDDAGASSPTTYVFPAGSIMDAGEIRVLCRFAAGVGGTFTYGIGGNDQITLANSSGSVLSTTGTLTGQGTTTVTIQLTNDGLSYLYAPATPGAPNAFARIDVVVNEVADKGALNTCGGTAATGGSDYIELLNNSPTPADISGWKLQDDTPNTFVIPNGTIVAPNGFLLYCQNAVGSFTFGIGGTDTISLFNLLNVRVSTTGVLLNLGTPSLTYSRRPNGNYSYTVPSPGTVNVFFSPLTGVIFINEVADKAVPGVCNGEDWVELINTGSTQVNLTGFLLHDDNGPTGPNAYTFPSGSFMSAGEIRLFCGNSAGNFQFGIGGDDTITLLDRSQAVVSTTGKLQSLGSATFTYQLNSNNMYVYGPPSPGSVNTVSSVVAPVLNEVAPAGTNIPAQCGGNPYVEVLNAGFQTLDLAGYVLSKGSLPSEKYVFPVNSTISVNAFALFCRGLSFNFSIGFNDTLTISSPSAVILSTTGAIGGLSPLPNTVGLTWSRVIDLINTTFPFTPFYKYSRDPTPGTANVFPFTPQRIPLQPCGVQSSPYANLTDYQFMELSNLNVDRNPELSGGTFDGRTCTHLVIGDEGTLNELTVGSNSTVSLIRSIPVIGGSRDTEAVCFWYDQIVGEKLVIADERDRSGKPFMLLHVHVSFSAITPKSHFCVARCPTFLFLRVKLPFVTYLSAISLILCFVIVQIVEC